MELTLTAIKAIPTGKCKVAKALPKDHNFVPPFKGASGQRVTATGPSGEEITGDVYRCYFCDKYFFVPIYEKFIGIQVKIRL